MCDENFENISHKGKFIFRDMDDHNILSMCFDDSLLDDDVDMGAEVQPQPPAPQEEAPPNLPQHQEARSDLLLVEDLGPDLTIEVEDGPITFNLQHEDMGDTFLSPPPMSSPPNPLPPPPPPSSLPPPPSPLPAITPSPHPSPLPGIAGDNSPTPVIPILPIPKPKRRQKTTTRTMASHPGASFGGVDVRLQKLSLNPQQIPQLSLSSSPPPIIPPPPMFSPPTTAPSPIIPPPPAFSPTNTPNSTQSLGKFKIPKLTKPPISTSSLSSFPLTIWVPYPRSLYPSRGAPAPPPAPLLYAPLHPLLAPAPPPPPQE